MSDEVLNEGDEGAIDPQSFEVKRGPGRPRKVVEPTAAAVPTVVTGSGPGAMPGATTNDAVLLALMQTIERLCDKLDTDPRDDRTLSALQTILEQNAGMLKETFRKENPRHPDESYANPLGERDHPRPGLRRPVRFLGIPLEQHELRRDEIELLNSFEQSMETPDHRWRASVVRTINGGEELFISVPFTGFDDLRGIGGLHAIVSAIKNGRQSHHGQTADDQIAAIRAQNAELQAQMAELRTLLVAKQAEQPVSMG